MLNVTLDIEQSLWASGVKAIAGVDEAGRGPLAGPVVAAAVVFPQELFVEGVNDSKKLTEKRRELLYDAIHSQACTVGVGIVDHETIDRINILQATLLAMQKALENLSNVPDYVLVDGNSFKHDIFKFQNIIDGDAKSFTIAAASIVAKVTRDRLMYDYDKLYPQYGFARHKGYGTKLHLDAIRQHGFCDIHRRSFHSV